MNTSKNKIKSLMLVLFLSVTAISTASARVCFLPDSTDCGSSDVNIPDVPCKYYNCKEAGLKNETYQTCYDERTYNNGGVNVNCKQVKCNISKSDCEAQAKATSQSCKFDDASGCYYLGECKQCTKDLYDLKEPKSGSDWECDSCTGCDGTFYNCTAKEKECYQINSNYTSSCSDSQTAEEVEGVKDSKGNQCYTCKSKPIDKCVDIEATPFLDIIEPTVTTVKASGEVKEVNAKLECGINPKKAYKYEAKITSDYDYINLPIQRIKTVEYRLRGTNSSGTKYFYKTSINGKNVCVTDRLCTQYADEGIYISAYDVSIQDMSTKKDAKLYCCKTDDDFKGDMLSHLSSSCKEVLPSYFEADDMDYLEPFYVCDKGIKEGTKCKIGSYSCPKDYKLSGDNCVKKECPKGYVLTSDNGKDVCVNPTYTCPTDGKYKYKLSGNQCVCDTSKTCSDINPDYYSMSDTEKYNECKRLDEYYNDSDIFAMETTDVIGSDGKCFYCHHRTCAEINEYNEYEGSDLLVKSIDECPVKECEHYSLSGVSWAKGADGQCYRCVRDYATVNILVTMPTEWNIHENDDGKTCNITPTKWSAKVTKIDNPEYSCLNVSTWKLPDNMRIWINLYYRMAHSCYTNTNGYDFNYHPADVENVFHKIIFSNYYKTVKVGTEFTDKLTDYIGADETEEDRSALAKIDSCYFEIDKEFKAIQEFPCSYIVDSVRYRVSTY